METKSSIFSRARAVQSTPKKARGFLSLPPELRNMIYQYYFEADFRCEIAAKGCDFRVKKTKTVKLWAGAFQPGTRTLQYIPKPEESAPITIRISRPLGRYTTVQGLQTHWSSSLFALHIVCRQIYAETVALIYNKTVFVFNAPQRIINFHNVISRPKLEYITSLQLHYSNYGCPGLANDRIWREKHNASWIRACGTASRKMVNLQHLKIWMQVHDVPLRFNLRVLWLLPLLQFRRLTQAPMHGGGGSNSGTDTRAIKLVNVDIDFRTRVSNHFSQSHRLAEANNDLHRLFGEAIRLAILGAKEEVAMAGFTTAWEGEYAMWQHHLGFAKTGCPEICLLGDESVYWMRACLCGNLEVDQHDHARFSKNLNDTR
ncbi:hypothetical protein BDU57DRAFT_591415 [Ampelomyces quisqualis]|uniref:DUF7730 domain-containing protein n=1 Tax=Ampelomyces quisqualis TaxID=50730 RepID=A0A6A5QZX3_AMPQU|nr:hypothetical protein BDU57DRAFT_591415 [Ampelomyces quisqualis]